MVISLNNSDTPNSDRSDQAQGNQGADTHTRVRSNHSVSHHAIRRLIQDALDPLLVDPVPTEVQIRNIRITQDPRGNLEISCEVSFSHREI